MLRRFAKIINSAQLMSGRHCTNKQSYEQNRISKESSISDILKQALPGIKYISVNDISGGCGDMFEISIEASEFKGLTVVKQHRLVTDCLKNEIEKMHGIRIYTTVPTE